MAWDGIERRTTANSYNGFDRRRPSQDRVPTHLAHLKDEQMLDHVRQLRRERFEYWDATEYLE